MFKSIGVAVLLGAVALSGCSSERPAGVSELSRTPSATSTEASTPTEPTVTAKPSRSKIAWLDLWLTDAITGRKFRLAAYKGKPILLHPFAVW